MEAIAEVKELAKARKWDSIDDGDSKWVGGWARVEVGWDCGA